MLHLVLPASVLGLGRRRHRVAPGAREPARRVLDGVRAASRGRWACASGRSSTRTRCATRCCPTITIVAFTFAFLLTGAVLTETVFTWPGVGSYAVDASRNLDFPAIIGVTILGGVAFLVTNLHHRHRLRVRRPADPAVVTAVVAPGAGRSDRVAASTAVAARRLPWSGSSRSRCGRSSRSRCRCGRRASRSSRWARGCSPPSCRPPDGHRRSSAATCSSARCGAPARRCRWRLVVIVSAVLIGTIVGAAAGFFGGWLDAVLMRLVDITMAFPPILLAMAITASLGPGIRNALIAMVLVWWPIYARLLRAQVIAVRQREYVESAHAIGASRWLDPAPLRPADVVHAGARQRDDGLRAGRAAHRVAQLHRPRRASAVAGVGRDDHRGRAQLLPAGGSPRHPASRSCSSCSRSTSSATRCATPST